MSSQEITKKMKSWLSSFSEDTSRNICTLYDQHASLWGTLSPLKRDNADLIKDYFDHIFKYQNRHVELNDANIRLFGDIAICSGQYTFRWSKEGQKVSILARFSFVYKKEDGQWLIIEHHSSAMPIAA